MLPLASRRRYQADRSSRSVEPIPIPSAAPWLAHPARPYTGGPVVPGAVVTGWVCVLRLLPPPLTSVPPVSDPVVVRLAAPRSIVPPAVGPEATPLKNVGPLRWIPVPSTVTLFAPNASTMPRLENFPEQVGVVRSISPPALSSMLLPFLSTSRTPVAVKMRNWFGVTCMQQAPA